MGPSVKFVSRINGSFSKKKIMGQFFIRKNTKPGGGGGRGRFGKSPDFSAFFFCQTFPKPLLSNYCYVPTNFPITNFTEQFIHTKLVHQNLSTY